MEHACLPAWDKLTLSEVGTDDSARFKGGGHPSTEFFLKHPLSCVLVSLRRPYLCSRGYSLVDEPKLPLTTIPLIILPNKALLHASWEPGPAGPRVWGLGKANEPWPILG